MAIPETVLTAKQEMFCQEYLIDLNATQAALRASYKESNAKQQGCENLSKPNIQERIAELNQARLDEIKVDAEFVLNALHKIASSSLKDMLDDDGKFLNVKDMPDHVAKTIQSIEIEETMGFDDKDEPFVESKTIKLKLWNKDKSLENLGKHLKLFTDKIELEGKITLEKLLSKSRE